MERGTRRGKDPGHRVRHAGGMILTEYGLRFTRDGDHWRRGI
jgi:hypothetical protein